MVEILKRGVKAPTDQYELLIKSSPGARLYDSRKNKFIPAPDIAFANGRVCDMGEDLREDLAQVLHWLDQNDIVVPPITSLHTHFAENSPWGDGMDVLQHSFNRGVNLSVDAGTTGINNFRAFYKNILNNPMYRGKVKAGLNIKYGGLSDQHGELETEYDLTQAGAEKTAEMALEYPGDIVYIKIRIGWLQASRETWKRALQQALKAAEIAGIPLMVHISDGPPLDEILALLRPGDIVTHCFHGKGERSASIMTNSGKRVRKSVKRAQKEGIIFSSGHGQGSFDVENGEAALQDGFLADSIDDDLHSGCVRWPTHDLLRVASKKLSIGYTLEDVLQRVTIKPRRVIGIPDSASYLHKGGVGDCSVIKVIEPEGGVTAVDAEGNLWKMKQILQPSFVVHTGKGTPPTKST